MKLFLTLAYILRKKNAIYIGCTGHNNLGDEAVLRATLKLFKKELGVYPIDYTDSNSRITRLILRLRKPKYILFGGGTIIKKRKHESYLRLLNANSKRFPTAKLLVFGPGVADEILAKQIGFPTDIEAWTEALQKAVYIGVRGEFSKRSLENWGLKNINITSDPALLYFKRPLAKRVCTKTIGINFCNIIGRIYGEDQKGLEEFAFELIGKLKSMNYQIKLFPTTPNDREYMMKLFKGIDNLIFEKYSNSVESFIERVSECDLFIGQRLHSLIFCMAANTPIIGVEYERKTSDFFSLFKNTPFIMRTDALNQETILSWIDEIYNDYDNYKLKLLSDSEASYKQLLNQAGKVKELIH